MMAPTSPEQMGSEEMAMMEQQAMQQQGAVGGDAAMMQQMGMMRNGGMMYANGGDMDNDENFGDDPRFSFQVTNPNNVQDTTDRRYQYPASAIEAIQYPSYEAAQEGLFKGENDASRTYFQNPETGTMGELIGDRDAENGRFVDWNSNKSRAIVRQNIFDPNSDVDMTNQEMFTVNPELTRKDAKQFTEDYYRNNQASSYNLGGFMKDNKQGILGGLQTAAGIGAMFIPGMQGLGTNLIGGGIGNITGEIQGDQQAEMQKKAMEQQQLLAKQQANLQPQQLDPYGNPIAPQGMYSRYGGKMYNVGGYMNGGYANNLPDENNMIDPSDIASTGGFLETPPNTTFGKGGNMYDDGGLLKLRQQAEQAGQWNFDPGAPTLAENTKQENYADVGDLSDTTMDLSINQSPLDFGLQLAPIAWNLAKGLQKPMEFKGEDFYTKIDPTLVDYTNAENIAKETGAGVMKGIKNTVPGGGSYASSMLASQQNLNKALSEIGSLETNTNSKLKGDADKLNITRKDAANMQALQMNLATQQAKELLQQEALTQGKGLSEQAIANKLAQNYAVMSAPDISRFKKVGYTPYYQQILESIKNRKTTPKI